MNQLSHTIFSLRLDDVIKITLDVSWQVSTDTEFELLQNGRGHAPDKIRYPKLWWSANEKGIMPIEDGGVTNHCEVVITRTT
jgi:hypothetical protein